MAVDYASSIPLIKRPPKWATNIELKFNLERVSEFKE